MACSPFASASEHAASIRANGQSCQELAELYLSRIHQHNPALHAIVLSNEAGALQAARERADDLRHNIVRGPLHGVPVTVKEAFNLEGLKTTVNFLRLKNNVATSDSLVVRRLKGAGAVVLGKTNIPTMLSDYQSFGPLYPTATNPYDATRTPGGSTGGGAAAVAAGLTTLEIGSDIGGSIRGALLWRVWAQADRKRCDTWRRARPAAAERPRRVCGDGQYWSACANDDRHRAGVDDSQSADVEVLWSRSRETAREDTAG
jgi:hypothetical protein